ncbi:hypothetical protein BH23CHL2_BH23CHL2_27130 [soil metagenome]
MPVGPLELLLILFCCTALFGLPTAALIWYILRRRQRDQSSDPDLNRDRQI